MDIRISGPGAHRANGLQELAGSNALTGWPNNIASIYGSCDRGFPKFENPVNVLFTFRVESPTGDRKNANLPPLVANFLSLKADAGDCARALPQFVALTVVVFALIVAVGGVANAWKIEGAAVWGACCL